MCMLAKCVCVLMMKNKRIVRLLMQEQENENERSKYSYRAIERKRQINIPVIRLRTRIDAQFKPLWHEKLKSESSHCIWLVSETGVIHLSRKGRVRSKITFLFFNDMSHSWCNVVYLSNTERKPYRMAKKRLFYSRIRLATIHSESKRVNRWSK